MILKHSGVFSFRKISAGNFETDGEDVFRCGENVVSKKLFLCYVKRFLLLACLLALFASCNKSTCPAYMNGSVTGTEGSREKSQHLFGKPSKPPKPPR